MRYRTPCELCDHKKVCGVKQRINECVDAINSIAGENGLWSNADIIFTCPYTTSVKHHEALMAYNKVLQ